jgi:hypothetical protein
MSQVGRDAGLCLENIIYIFIINQQVNNNF